MQDSRPRLTTVECRLRQEEAPYHDGRPVTSLLFVVTVLVKLPAAGRWR